MNIINKVFGGFIVALLAMLVVGIVSYRNVDILVANAEAERHTYEVLSKVELVLALMEEAEADQRGFLITGDETYLDLFEHAEANIDIEEAELRSLLSNDPIQLLGIDSLETIMALERAELQLEIDLYRREGFAAAQARMMTGLERTLMENAQAIIANLVAEEEAILAIQHEAELASVAATRTAIIGGFSAATVLMLLIGFGLRRQLRRSFGLMLSGVGMIGGGKLDHRILLHTSDELGQLSNAIDEMVDSLEASQGETVAKERVELILATASEVSSRLSSASNEILAAVTQQVSTTEEQAVSVAETMSTVDEITQTATQSAERAKGVAEQSNRSIELGREGREVVERSVANMT